MKSFLFVLTAALSFYACGDSQGGNDFNKTDTAATGFDIRWNNPTFDPNCNRLYISNYDSATQQANYMVGCAKMGDGSLMENVEVYKHIELNLDQTTLLKRTLENIDLNSLKKRYTRTNGLADGSILSLTLNSSEASKTLLVDATSSISSPTLVLFLNALDELGFLAESGYPL